MSGDTLVNADTGEIGGGFPDEIRMPWDPFTEAEADDHSHKITATAKQLCMLIKEAHDRQAHTALGYATWAEYVTERLDISRSRSYQLLAEANLLSTASGLVGLPVSTVVDTWPAEGATRGIGTDQLRQAITAAVMDLGPNPSTADRLAVVETTIETLRGEVREAKRQAAEAKAERSNEDRMAEAMAKAAAAANKAAETSDTGSSHPPVSDAPQQEPAPAAVQPPHGQTQQPTDVPEAEAAPGSRPTPQAGDAGDDPAPPALPDDPYDVAPIDHSLTIAALFDLDPDEVVQRLADDQREPVCTVIDDLADWIYRFTQALKEQRRA